MRESVRLTLQNSREIQLAAKERVKAAARIQEAWGEALPSIDVNAGYTRHDKQAQSGGVKIGDRDNYALSSTLSQPLWRGGAIGAGIRGATVFSALTDEQYRGVRQKVIFDVRKAYYDARLAFELEQSSRQSVELAKRQLEDVRKDRTAGIAANFDVLRAEVQLKNFVASHVQAQNRYNLAVTTLLRIMNVSQRSRITIRDPLEYRPIRPSLDTAVEQAFLNHSDLLQQEYDVRVQREAHKYAKAGYYPELDASLTAAYARPDPNDATRRHTWDTDWYASLSLTYPLFDGFRTRARVKQAEIDLQKSEILLRDTEERILLQIRQAILSITDAANFVESQQENVRQAQEALRLVRLGRRQGIHREVEVLDAQNALDKARANHAQAVYEHEIARLKLEQATGALRPDAAPPTPAAPPR